MRIHDLAPEVRPREKAFAMGLGNLSDEELLALVIGQGVPGASALEIAQRLIRDFGGFRRLGAYPWRNYEQEKGVSHLKALAIGAVFEIARRTEGPFPEERPKTDPKGLYERYKALLRGFSQERFVLLMLDEKGRLIKEETMYVGTSQGVRYSEGEIIKELAMGQASDFVIAHNHPSGNAVPSKGELESTLHLAQEAAKLHIRLLDHLIVSEDSYFSFREAGKTL
jgi:DNA repair protein RadC